MITMTPFQCIREYIPATKVMLMSRKKSTSKPTYIRLSDIYQKSWQPGSNRFTILYRYTIYFE